MASTHAVLAAAVAIVLLGTKAAADDGKLLATGGLSAVEGEGGGGLSAWALITGYETNDGIGVTAHHAWVHLSDYTLNAPGIAVGFYDRIELSYAAELFTLDNDNLAPGWLRKGRTLHEDVFGAKLRLIGDAVYDQDSVLPQIALGAQFKRSEDAAVTRAVGASSASGVDVYLAATKLLLAESLIYDVTLRLTKANQFGLLGFGGPGGGYQPEFEGSLGYLLSRHVVIGGEVRTRPSELRQFAGNLPIAGEERAYDLFATWFFNMNLSLTAAWLDLGRVADVAGLEPHRQNGAYLSFQAAF